VYYPGCSAVNAHKLRNFLIVGYGAESAPQLGVVQEQLQSDDNSKHGAGSGSGTESDRPLALSEEKPQMNAAKQLDQQNSQHANSAQKYEA
jgi:hypothetical protein